MSKNKNPLSILSKATGISQGDIKKIGEQVRINNDLLRNCKRHNFALDLNPNQMLGKVYKCSRCGGTVDAVKRMWYQIGLEHGKMTEEDDLK